MKRKIGEKEIETKCINIAMQSEKNWFKKRQTEDPLSLLVLFYIPYPHQLNQEVVRLIEADMVDIQIPKGESVLQKLKKEANFVLKQLDIIKHAAI